MVLYLAKKFEYQLFFDQERIGSQLEVFSNAVFRKCNGLRSCWGFIDGTARACARPSTDQRALYSGHKRVHCIKFQNITTPDGIISHLYGPEAGRHHDLYLLSRSGIREIIQDNPDFNGYILYGDSGYCCSDIICTPFKSVLLSPEEREFNQTMSSVRESVEWAFGRVSVLFAFLYYERTLKILLSPIGEYYKVGILLTNLRTILSKGNQISDYFDLATPSLHDYLGW